MTQRDDLTGEYRISCLCRQAWTPICSPPGEPPVNAPASGVVEQVSGSVGGYQFILCGDDGTTYVASHMGGFAASGRVEAGTIIGYVGDSGNPKGTDPHLHFQIHPQGGGATNPYPSLAANQC